MWFVNVKFGFLADYANQSAGGKINAMGTFDRIRTLAFPLMQPQLALVLAFDVTSVEAGIAKNFQVSLVSAEGKVVVPPLNLMVSLPPPPAPGPVATLWQAVNLRNVVFPAEGDYEFCVTVDGHQAYAVSLHLEKVEHSHGTSK